MSSRPPIGLRDGVSAPASPSNMNQLKSWYRRSVSTTSAPFRDWFHEMTTRINELEQHIRDLTLGDRENYAKVMDVQQIPKSEMKIHLSSGNPSGNLFNNIINTGNSGPPASEVFIKVRAYVDNCHSIIPLPEMAANDPNADDRTKNRACMVTEFYGTLNTSKPKPAPFQVVKVSFPDSYATTGRYIESTSYFISPPGRDANLARKGAPEQVTIGDLTPRAIA